MFGKTVAANDMGINVLNSESVRTEGSTGAVCGLNAASCGCMDKSDRPGGKKSGGRKVNWNGKEMQFKALDMESVSRWWNLARG